MRGIFFSALVACLLLCETSYAAKKKSKAPYLNEAKFKERVAEDALLVLFCVRGDEICRQVGKIFNQLAREYNDADDTLVARVDCANEVKLCDDSKVAAFPSVMLFTAKNPEGIQYAGSATAEKLGNFLDENTDAPKEKDPNEAEVVAITDSEYKQQLASGYVFVKFYAPWCGYCQELEPTWEKLAQNYDDYANLIIAKIDCTKHKEACKQFPVEGFPTLLLIKDGKMKEKFTGARDMAGLRDFIKLHVKKEDKPASGKPSQSAQDKLKKPVLRLTAKNFDKFTVSGYTFIKFFTPSCGFCNVIADDWVKLGKDFIENKDVKIAEIDCSVETKLCHKHGVHGYPGLWLFHNGRPKRECLTARTINDWLTFLGTNVKQEEVKTAQMPKKKGGKAEL